MHEQSMARPSDGWRRVAAWFRDALAALARRATAPPALPERTAEEMESLRVARAEAERRYAFRIDGRRIGCLLVHGLTSTPQSMRALGEYLAAHGVDVEAVLLPGHGTTPEDLETTAWEVWYDAVRSALDRLRPRCDSVFVCGQSMGGALALRAAAREPVDGVITLAAFLYLRDWRLRFLPLARRVVHWRKCIGNDIADPQARDEVCYDRLALRSVEELVELGEAAKQDLPRVTVPALVMQSRVDHVVPPDTADFIYDHIGAADRELVRLEHSYHVISMDHDREIVAERVLRFLRRIAYTESARRR